MRIVPFKGTVRAGSRGKAVVAYKRALSRAGFMRWGTFTPLFGPFAVRALRSYQRSRGLSADGVIGPATHASLANARAKGRPGYAMDSRALWLLAQVKSPTSPNAKVDKIVGAALLALRKRGEIYYTQSRWRMWGVRNRIRPPAVPRWEDCSSFVTWLYWVAGCPDPNGRGYDGYGFTGTLAVRGVRVSTPQPGDLVFYGPYPHRHVAIYIGGGKVVSHGSSGGPYLLSMRYRSDLHSIRRYRK